MIMHKNRKLIVALDNIRSTYNVGSILRTSEALGVEEIIYGGYTPYPKVENDDRIPHLSNKIDAQIAKVSLKTQYNLKHLVKEDLLKYLIDMKRLGFKIYSLEQAESSVNLESISKLDSAILVLGNEVSGVDKNILEISDAILEIPLLGNKESLNVAQAAAIAIYQLTK